LLAAGRRIGYYDRKLRTPQGVSWGVYAESGLPVHGRTLGIIGMGRIGQSLARRAVASGMNIIYHNRRRLDESIENCIMLDMSLSKSCSKPPITFHLTLHQVPKIII